MRYYETINSNYSDSELYSYKYYDNAPSINSGKVGLSMTRNCDKQNSNSRSSRQSKRGKSTRSSKKNK